MSKATEQSPPFPQAPVHADDLKGAIQQTLSELAEVDLAYEKRTEAITRSAASIVQKRRLRAEADRLHRCERERHLLRLADLHYRLIRASLVKTVH